jgi:hypothetical protein
VLLNIKIEEDHTVSVHLRNNEGIVLRYEAATNTVKLLDKEKAEDVNADCKIIINSDLEEIKKNISEGVSALSGKDIQFMKKPGEDISKTILVLKSLSKRLLQAS